VVVFAHDSEAESQLPGCQHTGQALCRSAQSGVAETHIKVADGSATHAHVFKDPLRLAVGIAGLLPRLQEGLSPRLVARLFDSPNSSMISISIRSMI